MQPAPPAYKCSNCGRTTTYARLRCLNCRGETFEAAALPDTATLLTLTEIHQLPVGFDERFLRVGIVEFAGGARAMGWVTFEGAETGTQVEVRWEPIRDSDGEPVYGFAFYPEA
ncbi:MAG: OB-fold domain-containing protein [Candidatus Eisenbacteria sp.]|nr:OB-fold domain-containing protein [Candidatus Eisenbacteria bacterium]